jgi:hypothetical protein
MENNCLKTRVIMKTLLICGIILPGYFYAFPVRGSISIEKRVPLFYYSPAGD